MSEAKHTPGPWIVDTDYIIQDGGTSDENTIAIVGDQEEWKANAHLIAAAPDLLEALEDCCVIAKPENPPCCCPNYQPLPDGDCAEAKNGDCHIWEAIQKARGQDSEGLNLRITDLKKRGGHD